MLTAMVSAFFVDLNSVPTDSVQAAETSAIKTDIAGSYEGTGFYPIGETAMLKATMNNGYRFLGWIEVDENGNWEDDDGNPLFDNPLSTNLEYSFVVERNIYIGVKWEKIVYNVSLTDGLEQDFELSVANSSGSNDTLYYGDNISITLRNKNTNYIYDLTRNNIYLNTKNLSSLTHPSNIQNGDEGFKNLQIDLSVVEDILIDIDFDYMYTLTLQSLNADVAIENLLDRNLISVQDAYGKLTSSSTVQYLVWSRQAVTINAAGGDDVYQFAYSQFNDQSPSILASQTFVLDQPSTFSVSYNKKGYQVEFEYYLMNSNGGYDKMDIGLYDIPARTLTAGENFTISHNANQITIGEDTYDKLNILGYRFVGITSSAQFDQASAEYEFAMDATQPKNSQIQIIFELIQYKLSLGFVDEFFQSGVQTSLSTTTPTVQTDVKVAANTDIYQILGWSWEQSPTDSDYLSSTNEYTFRFEPQNDDDAVDYIIYLDIDYKYLSANYALNANSILKNMDYDVVKLDGDATSGTLTFSSSENDRSVIQITYAAEDVVTNGEITTIDTKHSTFGEVKISNAWTEASSILYGQLSKSSISTRKEDAAYVYTFQKYTYFADLKLAKIDSASITEDGGNIVITLEGTAYQDDGSTAFSYEISGAMLYSTQLQCYTLSYVYPVQIFKQDGEMGDYTKLIIMGSQFNWSGTKFVQSQAEIHTRKPIGVQFNKSNQYGITLTNTTPTDLLIFVSNPVDVNGYGFVSNSKNGSILTAVIMDATSKLVGSMLNGEQDLSVVAEYVRLEGDIVLAITNTNAYSSEDVKITINGSIGYGLKITALENDSISIEIANEKITAGYQFGGFRLDGEYKSTENILEITMGNAYVNKTIYLVFAPIEYIINVHYLDNTDNEITNVSALNGILAVNGASENITVDIEGSFEFVATPNAGYYVANAYFGAQAYNLGSLVQSNTSAELSSRWQLTSSNFASAILGVVGEGAQQVDLYIKFAIHTYTATVYFEIGADESRVSKPTVLFNSTLSTFSKVIEGDKDRYKIVFEGVRYGDDLTIKINANDISEGIVFSYWKDENGNTGTTTKTIILTAVSGDIVLTAVFDYIQYDRVFVYLDENGEEVVYTGADADNNRRGSAISTSNSYRKFQEVEYRVTINNGYVLSEEYYLNKTGAKVQVLAHSFEFDPSSVNIEDNKFKIYLKFDLKAVNLTITNTPNEGMNNKYSGVVKNYEVTKIHGGYESELTDETGYQVQTGDQLTIRLYPVTIGVELVKIKLGNTSLNSTSGVTFTLNTVEVKQDEVVTEIYYELTIIFNVGTITPLETETELNSIFDNRKYVLTYTHTLIEYKPGIKLAVVDLDNPRQSSLLGADKVYQNTEFPFGKYMEFKCADDSLNSIRENFTIRGFKVAGENIATTEASYKLNSLEMWEQIALNRYNSDSPNRIDIVLNLSPKITLRNANVNGNSYLYNSAIYNGERQGLTKDGLDADVVIGGSFPIVITYSTDRVSYTEDAPINAGEYNVKIFAKIGVGSEVVQVEFDGVVTYVINKKVLKVSTTFNKDNPLSKTYDGSTDVNTNNLYGGLRLDGICLGDVVNLDSNRLRGNYSSSQVNIVRGESDLYNVSVTNLYLRDADGREPQNYALQFGESGMVFERIGKINPKQLFIRGFEVDNKVYDGTTSISVNTDNIDYDGKLESDSTKIITSNLKFYLKDSSVGYNREVLLDFSEALTGADSTNYTVSYNKTFVNIYPYEKECKIEGFGVFKIVDRDKRCLIPIDAEFIGTAYVNGSIQYRDMYPIVETYLRQTENFDFALEFKMKIGVATSSLNSGLYLYMPRDGKLSKVLHFYEENDADELPIQVEDDYDIIKIEQGQTKLAILRRTTYIALWVIILIVALALLFISLLVLIFIIIRKRKRKKYSVNDKI